MKFKTLQDFFEIKEKDKEALRAEAIKYIKKYKKFNQKGMRDMIWWIGHFFDLPKEDSI